MNFYIAFVYLVTVQRKRKSKRNGLVVVIGGSGCLKSNEVTLRLPVTFYR